MTGIDASTLKEQATCKPTKLHVTQMSSAKEIIVISSESPDRPSSIVLPAGGDRSNQQQQASSAQPTIRAFFPFAKRGDASLPSLEDAKRLLQTAGPTDAKEIDNPNNSRVILSKFADRCQQSGSETSAGETSEDEEDDSLSDKSTFINDAEIAPASDKQRVRKFLDRFTGKRTPKGRRKAARAPLPAPPRRRVIHDSD